MDLWDGDAIDLLGPATLELQLSGTGRFRFIAVEGEFFPNVTEAGSGLVFAEFFQNERDGSRKGIVVLKLKGRT